MKFVCAMLALLCVVPAMAQEPKPQPKKPQTIPTLMREAHMKGRQVYRSLDMLLISGRSTAEERKRFVEIYSQFREMKPPQGTVESWQYDIDRITDLVKAMDAAKDEKAMLEKATSLFYATNCNACHDKYRWVPTPAPGELPPKSLAVGSKAVAAGGKNWTAPQKLDLGEVKYMQPGRRMTIWPAEDVVYQATRGNDVYADVYVKLNWALAPGANPPFSQLSGLYYHYYDLGNKNAHSYQFAKPDKIDAREGEFWVNFRVVAKDRPEGEYELAFVAVTNELVPVPVANFVKVKYRLPK